MQLTAYEEMRRRNGRRQWALVGVACAAVGAALVVAARVTDPRLPPLAAGSPAPALEVADLAAGGRPRTLADYRGQVVLLDLWALSCANCMDAMPELNRLQRDYGPRGLRVVTVSLDGAADSAAARATVARLAPDVATLADLRGTVRAAYRVYGLPNSFLIGRDGRIRRQVLGVLGPGGGGHVNEWATPDGRALIEAALAAGPPGRATHAER